MNRLFAAVLIISCVMFLPCSVEADFQKTKIAVLDFQLQGSNFYNKDMGEIVAEWLITAFVKEGRFDVVERRLLQKIVDEQKLAMSGMVDANSATELGKLLGVKVVITGSVMKVHKMMEVNARIIDVESASIIAAESVKSASAIQLETLVNQMAAKIIRDFPLEGYIVHRDGDKVQVDLGKRAGVKKGMRFIVYKEGNVIRHPKTGEVLDVERIETGNILIKDVRKKTAEAKILSENSSNAIAYGQMVRTADETSEPVGKYSQPATKNQRHAQAPELRTLLDEADILLAEATSLKADGGHPWNAKTREVMVKLKTAKKYHPRSAIVYLYFAKTYKLMDNPGGALKYLEKAIYFEPTSIKANEFKGDAGCELARQIPERKKRKRVKYIDIIRNGYESAARNSKENKCKARMFFKLGCAYDELIEDQQKAEFYWKRAVSIAPESPAGQKAAARMGAQKF